MQTGTTSITWRERLDRLLRQRGVESTLMALIILNAITLRLETYPQVMQAWGHWLLSLDKLILYIFVVEIALRIAARGLRFFRDPWSIFDFIVVGIALLPASGPFAVLRALRVLRVLRILTMVPSMRRVVGGLLGALPGLGSVIAVMFIVFYVSAVMSTKLFGSTFPDGFGSLGNSAYTLFQIMTLESWSMGIARPVMEVFPLAWVFFVIFILIATFTMLNLFIGVVVNAIQAEAEGEQASARDAAVQHRDDQHARTCQEIGELRAQVAGLQALLEKRLPGGPSSG